MKLLIAYDGSDCSDIALTDLRNAGLPEQAEALIICAADTFVPNVEREEDIPAQLEGMIKKARDHANEAVETARANAERAAATLQSMFPQWKIATSARIDSPAWAIVNASEEWHPDMIVVGSHGYGFFHKARLGSVSEKVVLEARCSVHIAKNAEHPVNTPLRIVLGYDGSDDAKAGLQSLLKRSFASGTKVHVVSAMDLRMVTALGFLSGFAEEMLDLTRDDDHAIVQKLVDGAVAQLNAKGFDASGSVEEGDPKKVLVSHAEEWQADLIMVGAHGTTRTERFMMGSVSSAITSRAHCSVEVIRPQSAT
jgi:nucleotide-binding universal stress UspA family protein